MSWESDEDYVYELAFVGEDGQMLNLFGANTVRVNKETGEVR